MRVEIKTEIMNNCLIELHKTKPVYQQHMSNGLNMMIDLQYIML